MVLSSCSSDAPQSSDKAQDAASIYDLTLTEHAILAPLRNRQNGTPRPKYFYDTSDGSAYVYTMQPAFNQYIRTYRIDGDTLELVDSLAIPKACFDGVVGRIEEFFVLAKDSFLIEPYFYDFSQKTNKCFFLGKTHLDSLITAKGSRDTLFSNDVLYAFRHQDLTYQSKLIRQQNYSYTRVENTHLLKYKHPIITINDMATGTDTSLFSYPKHLQSVLGKAYLPLLSTQIEGKLIMLIPAENAFYTLDLNTYQQSKVEFNNSYMDQSLDFDIKDKMKRKYEADFYVELVYNPFLEQLVLIQHEAAPYESEDGMTIHSLASDKKRVLVFDKNLKLESNSAFETDRESFYMFLQPTPNGFLDFEHKVVGNHNYKLQEYVLTTRK
ncbi:hypothetical protein [Pseudoalteromonas marina]|uniref:hypothetical protein n=1 Tax=Pseudoalteromonas marina TaxID=267375 RepID=UPI003C4C8FA7